MLKATISLSPSKVGACKNCPRCFYDAIHYDIETPRGIFPSLPGGVDRVMKDMMDANRLTWPTQLAKEMAGRTLWGTVSQMNKLRNWKSGLRVTMPISVSIDGAEKTVTVEVIGALDDLAIEANGQFSPYDTKTKGSEPSDAGLQYYQHQLDLYALMLRANKMPPSGKGYLAYWYPVDMASGSLSFAVKLYEVTADAERGVQWLRDTVAVLLGRRPESHAKCEYCKLASARCRLERSFDAQPSDLTLSA